MQGNARSFSRHKKPWDGNREWSAKAVEWQLVHVSINKQAATACNRVKLGIHMHVWECVCGYNKNQNTKINRKVILIYGWVWVYAWYSNTLKSYAARRMTYPQTRIWIRSLSLKLIIPVSFTVVETWPALSRLPVNGTRNQKSLLPHVYNFSLKYINNFFWEFIRILHVELL